MFDTQSHNHQCTKVSIESFSREKKNNQSDRAICKTGDSIGVLLMGKSTLLEMTSLTKS